MIQIEANIGEEWDSSTGWHALAENAVRSAVARSRFPDLGGEVSVKFTSDEELRGLNAAWRGKDKATNVLSFPMMDSAELGHARGEALLGDIVLAYGVCAREAADKDVPVETHAAHLLVHGALHLLGYDHETGDEDAEEMERIEREALAAIGIPDPYHVTEVQS